MGDLEDDLTSDEAMAATHDQVERMLAEKGRELLRQMMQAHYDAKAARERRVEVTGADGVARTQARTATRQLETLFGTVEKPVPGLRRKGGAASAPTGRAATARTARPAARGHAATARAGGHARGPEAGRQDLTRGATGTPAKRWSQ